MLNNETLIEAKGTEEIISKTIVLDKPNNKTTTENNKTKSCHVSNYYPKSKSYYSNEYTMSISDTCSLLTR